VVPAIAVLWCFFQLSIAKSPPVPTGIQGFMYDIRTAILPFMFIFNPDLILHNVNSWTQGFLIFVMACFGNFTVASATQGWFMTRNRIYEIPLFLGVTLILMRQDLIADWLGMPQKSALLDVPHRIGAFRSAVRDAAPARCKTGGCSGCSLNEE